MKAWWRKPSAPPRLSVLMVCMGNICRSPTAEGVLRHKLKAAGMEGVVAVDSAGTHGYHVGEPPDARAQRHALARGIDLSALRGRKVAEPDFERFQFMLAMDHDNLAELERLRPGAQALQPRLLMDFARRHAGQLIVPDPYYGAPDGFEHVLDLVDDACDGLLLALQERLSIEADGTS